MKNFLRLLATCLFFSAGSSSAGYGYNGKEYATQAAVCGAFRDPHGHGGYMLYGERGAFYTCYYNCNLWGNYLVAMDFRTSSDYLIPGTPPGECSAGKVALVPSGECVVPVTCAYPEVRDVATNTCKPELVCPAGKTLKIIGINPNSSGCYSTTTPPPAGSAGGNTNPDGSCNSGLTAYNGTCVLDGGGNPSGGSSGSGGGDNELPKPDGTCTSPAFINPATGLCTTGGDAGEPPKEDGSCTPPAIPDPVNPGICVTNACSDSSGVTIHSGFNSTISEITPSGPGVSAFLPAAPVPVVCVEGCRYSFIPNPPPFIDGLFISLTAPYEVGSVIRVFAKFYGEGQACLVSDSVGLPGSAASPGAGFGVAPVGCPEGQHNNNASPPACVPDGLSYPVGQHVVQFGIGETGSPYETCVSDSTGTGNPGQPPNVDGTCVPPLINVNGFCTDAGGAGIVGTGGTPGGATQSGQCGSPGFPACTTDVGTLLGQSTELGDPTAATGDGIKGLLNIPAFSALKSWAMPSHASSCPTLDFTAWDHSVHIDQHCTLINSISSLIQSVSLLGWSIMAILIVLSA